MKLPSRRKLPDYYDIIKRPIDIKKILAKIEDTKVCVYDKLVLLLQRYNIKTQLNKN